MNFIKHYLSEMPWSSTGFDFEIEKPGWPDKMISAIQNYKNINKLLASFYDLQFKFVFAKRYNLLPEEEKEKLKRVLPPQFLKDMGVLGDKI